MVRKICVLLGCTKRYFGTLDFSDGAKNLGCLATGQARARKKMRQKYFLILEKINFGNFDFRKNKILVFLKINFFNPKILKFWIFENFDEKNGFQKMQKIFFSKKKPVISPDQLQGILDIEHHRRSLRRRNKFSPSAALRTFLRSVM